ncbi:MAG: hypothetical protein RLZ94_270, partial [Actinomycetota bacterium]
MNRPGSVPQRASRRSLDSPLRAVTGYGPFADGLGGVTPARE